MHNNDKDKNNNENDEENKNKSAKEASDEIINILDDYRKKHGEAEQETAVPEQEQPEPEDIAQPEDSLPKTILSHFSSEGENLVAAEGSLNPHFSCSADKKELQKAQKLNKETRFKKEKKPRRKFNLALGGGSVLLKALFYIAFVFILSAYLSYYIIAIGNDVFALVKEPVTATIMIDENTTQEELTQMLEEKNIIEFGWVFNLYLKYRSDDDFTFIAGEYELNADMNYTQIIQRLTLKYTERIQVRVVIPEGFTVDQIIDLFLENGIGTREGFVEAINNYPYKHEYVQALGEIGYSEHRKYRLEGYLFPDTYDFYKDTAEYMIINKLLNNFGAKFWRDYEKDYKEICESYGMTFDDLITLASMIEAEGNNALDFEYISYVFHNRLKNAKAFPYLESDATIQYALEKRREDLTVDDLALDDPYNSYLYEGLPPGSICNPGYDAISAALYPSAPENDSGKTINAFYFVSNKAGKTYYSATLSGHNQNKAQAKKDNEAIASGTYNN